MSIIKDFIVKAGILVQGTSSTVSTGSGALIVQGGAGIAGSVYAGGIATLGAINPGTGSTTTTGAQTLRVTAGGIGVTDDSYINGALKVSGKLYSTDSTDATSTNSAAVTLIGGLGVGGSAYFGGQVFVQGAGVVTTATLGNYGVSAIYGGTDTVVTTATGVVYVYNTSTLQSITNRGAVTTNAITVDNNTLASSTSTGALIIQNGGLGVGGSAFFGANLNVGAALTVTGVTYLLNTTDATSVSSGALQLSGGLGVAKNIYAQGQVITSNSASVVTVGLNALAITAGGIGVAGTALIQGNAVISSTTNGTTTSTGQALLVSGGVGVGQNLVAGKVITKNTEAATTVGAGSLQVAGGAYIADNVAIMGTADSPTTTSSNALYVAGSVGIEKNLYVSGEIVAQKLTIQYTTVTTTIVETDDVIYTSNNQNAISTATGALQVPYGGAGIGRDLFVGGSGQIDGDFNITGNLSFGSGTTASGSFGVFYGDIWGSNAIYGGISGYTALPNTVLQLTANTSTYAQANFQNINSGTQASADFVLTADNGTDGSHFVDLGIASSTYDYPGYEIIQPNDGYLNVMDGNLVFYTASTGQNIKFYTGGSATLANTVTNVANFKLELQDDAGVFIPVVLNSTSTTTGALVVSGGVGIGKDLRVNGTIYGNLAGLVTTATNLAGGAQGSIPVQTAEGTTGMLAIGSNGYVLSSNGTTAVWQSLGTITAGTATNALNIAITGTDSTSAYFPAIVSAVYPAGSMFEPVFSTSTFSIVPKTGVTTFEGTVDSTTSTAGTAVIKGGVGIAKAVVIGSTLTTYGPVLNLNTTSATNVTSGALQVSGGAGIAGSVYAGALYDSGWRAVTSVTPTAGTGIAISAVTTGTATTFTVVNHGVQTLTGSTYIGVSSSTGTVTLTNLGVQTLTAGTDTAISSTTGTVTIWDTSTLQSVTGRGAATTNAVTISNTTNSTTTATGALIVSGGAGIGRTLNVGGTITRTGNLSANAWSSNGVGITAPAATYTDLTSNGAVATAAIHSLGQPTITASGGTISAITDAATLYIANAPANGSGVTAITNAWALQIAAGNVKIAASTVNNGNVTSGALVVGGGVGIAGALTVGGIVQAGTAATGSAVNGFQSNNLLLSSYTSNSISTTATVNLDIWSTSTYRSARYSIQLVDTLAVPNRIHYTEMVLIHDGNASVYKSEYGVITNVGELGTFDATVTTSGVQLTFTPSWPTLTPSALVVKSVRTTIS